MNDVTSTNREGLLSSIRNEFRAIFSDGGVLLIIVFAMLIYTTIYSLAYGKEVVESVAIAVVDSDKTPSSRVLINGLSSGPNTAVCYEVESEDEARRLFYERKVFGIVVIPNGFEGDLLSGKQANIATILDGSHLLLYRQVLEQATKDALTDGATIEAMRMVARGVDDVEAATIIQPIEYEEHVLYNSAMGYGSFVMPSIVVVVIQQTLLIGLAMLGVRRKKMPVPNASIIIGIFAKILTYLIIYGVNLIIILGILWPIFGFPYEGRTVDVVVVFALYITASVALGISLSHLFSKREEPLMLLLWISIPILLLAGVSYPKEAFPEWLHLLGRVFPSSSAVNAYVDIGTAGASLGNVMTDIVTLVVLSIVYICLAFFAEKISAKSMRT